METLIPKIMLRAAVIAASMAIPGAAWAQPSSPPTSTPAPPGPLPPASPTPPEQIAPPAPSSGVAAGGASGVIRPPAGVDPGIQSKAPAPTPNSMPVILPPGTPGGNPTVQPK
jgi:hypothetical protein